MAYTPPDRHALLFDLGGGYAPPDRHALEFELPSEPGPEPEPYVAPLVVTARMRWRQADIIERQAQLPIRDAEIIERRARAAWTDAERLERELRLRWSELDVIEIERGLRLSPADVIEQQRRLRWGNVLPRGPDVGMRWGSTVSVGSARRLAWRNRASAEQQRRLRSAEATPQEQQRRLATGRALVRERQTRLPWRQADDPQFRYRLPIPTPPPVPPRPHCYTPDRHALQFRLGRAGFVAAPPDRHALAFNLLCGDGRRFDVRSTLSMSHSLSVVRLPDRLPLHVRSVQISGDRDSWGRSFSIAFRDVASLVAVEPTPAGKHCVEITLDGYVFVAEIHGYSETRAFADRAGTVSGRHRAAALTRLQRSFVQDETMTAQQLALRELEFSGFALDWQLGFDWVVPAGAWSYERASAMDALSQIAAAAGAMVQTAADADTIVIAPHIPAPAWALDEPTPDFTLAGGSWLRKGKTYAEGGRYNGALIIGKRYGVNVIAYRPGTSGSPYAQQIVDPLTTDTQPALARAARVVADSQDRHEIPIELPLTPAPLAPGLLMPGELGLIEDTVWGTYRAVVDGVTISAEVADNGLVTANQSATLWRYLPEELT